MPVKSHTKIRTSIIKYPFPHMLIQNFLTPQLYRKAFNIYNGLEFKQKFSDLFKFFQTDELNQYAPLEFFREALDGQFFQLQPMKSDKIRKQQTFYNIFASYYFEGNYLLCHDDLIQDRCYAFSYYLQDYDSGDLILFDRNGEHQVKRIKVVKNCLAIFEVSDGSYHEVDYCQRDGRKAITGWFNIKGLEAKRKDKTIGGYIPILPVSKPLEYKLPDEYFKDEYFQVNDIKYQFNITKSIRQGPFYSRKVHKIEINPMVIFVLSGYRLYSVQLYQFKVGQYLLLNDPSNTLNTGQIIDIFVTHLPKTYKKTRHDMLVKITQPDEDPSGIEEIDDSLFVVKRGNKKYYVDRIDGNQKQFMLAHFMYVKEEESGKLCKKCGTGNVDSVASRKLKNRGKLCEKEGKKLKTKAIKKQKQTQNKLKETKTKINKSNKTKINKSKKIQK